MLGISVIQHSRGVAQNCAAGGNIVKVLREDDPDGRWNYEVFVTANGKESGFEVDPNGKVLREHSE
jgi:uncharacterized membrane protein YkoI